MAFITILTFSGEVKVFSTMARDAIVVVMLIGAKAEAVAGSKVNGN